MRKFTQDEKEQLKELELTFDQHLKIKKYKRQALFLFALVTIASLFLNVTSSLDVNLKLFMFIAMFSTFSAVIIVLNGIAYKSGMIKGDNWLMRILSDFRLFKALMFLTSICIGLAFGAVIKDCWVNGFHTIDVVYVLMCSVAVLMALYIHKLMIPMAILQQDMFIAHK